MTQLKRIQNIFCRHRVANKLEACWFQQGQIAARMGLSPDNLNRVQRAGYRAAMTVRREVSVQFGR